MTVVVIVREQTAGQSAVYFEPSFQCSESAETR